MALLQKRHYQKVVRQVLQLAPTYQQMSDAELQKQTQTLKTKVNGDRSHLKSVLPEAYAIVCEAADRVLGLRPYPVQILGAVAMEDGNIAEMKTGEGKTLTATMPMYLHGLMGSGNFLITANEYLAARDAHDMGILYKWLGLTVASAVPELGQKPEDRDLDAIYQSDIVYTTNSTLGFDYLFDNLAKSPQEQHLRALNFALLDEADAVLLDTAQTPLVISGVPRVQSNYYQSADQVVKLLELDEDYQISDDQKSAWFTPRGIVKMEQYLDVDNLLSKTWTELYRHLVLALRANYIQKRNRNYVVKDNEVVLIDAENGRELPGMKMQAGMHQALEAKEQVEISTEQRTMATITYQDLFRMFNQLAGMTGTAATDKKEFLEVYNLSVFKVPTNKPSIRKDLPDHLFISNRAKLLATLAVVKKAHSSGRPVLVETGSLELSVLYSNLLLKERIPHSLLNARSEVKEAEIIRNAGEIGAVTVATSMAGRGTDITISEEVEKLGGLLVLGTERMQNRRIDNQLRGRAGRQGEPGESVFYVSLEDKVVTENAPKSIRKFAYQHAHDQNQTLSNRGRFRNAINRSQRILTNQERNARFETLQYGEVSRIQRESVYQTRNLIMQATNLDALVKMCFQDVAKDFVNNQAEWIDETQTLLEFVYQNIDPDYQPKKDLEKLSHADQLEVLQKIMKARLVTVHQQLPHQDQWIYFERLAVLRAVDQGWVEQVDQLEMLMQVTKSRSIAQVNPIFEYQKEAQKAYRSMRSRIKLQVVRNLTNSEVIPQSDGTVDVEFP
ncbi:accessory Sec system translocase SecA2 [Fructilactobacillus cliffordii]|uniref:accessory Sec system translocase SecA2 n=1 Tax=Fructilactobacillus cliffordii TaxID=2940299 RepID=UPI002093EAAC|nr:accessory Sec system translocase SecA2 [Fructilactobacillus cliffordii]USS86922.1 accessory Sec system translocase SecA2 [Fructilactobacillus cliffordii]